MCAPPPNTITCFPWPSKAGCTRPRFRVSQFHSAFASVVISFKNNNNFGGLAQHTIKTFEWMARSVAQTDQQCLGTCPAPQTLQNWTTFAMDFVHAIVGMPQSPNMIHHKTQLPTGGSPPESSPALCFYL